MARRRRRVSASSWGVARAQPHEALARSALEVFDGGPWHVAALGERRRCGVRMLARARSASDSAVADEDAGAAVGGDAGEGGGAVDVYLM